MGTGSVPLGGSYERGKFPLPWEPPSKAGRSDGTDRGLQRLRGDHSNQLMTSRTEKDQHR